MVYEKKDKKRKDSNTELDCGDVSSFIDSKVQDSCRHEFHNLQVLCDL